MAPLGRSWVAPLGRSSTLTSNFDRWTEQGVRFAFGKAAHPTLVELADRILSATFDRTASKLSESILRRENVDVRTGTTVEEIIGRGGQVDHGLRLVLI